MRVLLTGADGFVGQHVARLLLARGHQVAGAAQGPPGPLPVLDAGEAAAVRWLAFDLADADSVARLVRESAPEAVVHLAGSSSVGRSWGEPERVLRINAMGALHLLLALRALPAAERPRPVLLVGSAEEYGAEGTEARPLTEDLPLRPLNPYGASKAAQEMIGWALGRPGLRVIHTRSFPHSGPGQRPPFVLPQWTIDLLAMRGGRRPPTLAVGDLDVVRDLTDVRDVADAYVGLLEAPAAEGAYNVCSGRGFVLRDLLARLCARVGVEPEVRTDPERLRPVEIRSLVGSFARLHAATGWFPRTGLDGMLDGLIGDLERSA